MKFIAFFISICLVFNIFAKETLIEVKDFGITKWYEQENKQYFKDGNFFIFDNDGMNEILAYKKTAELYKDLKIECPECNKNNTIWYLVSFGVGIVLGGLLIKVIK